MAIGNVKLIQECFPKHLRIETARMKEDRIREEKDKEKSAYGKKYSRYEKKKV